MKARGDGMLVSLLAMACTSPSMMMLLSQYCPSVFFQTVR
jgi:hypothetical protein